MNSTTNTSHPWLGQFAVFLRFLAVGLGAIGIPLSIYGMSIGTSAKAQVIAVHLPYFTAALVTMGLVGIALNALLICSGIFWSSEKIHRSPLVHASIAELLYLIVLMVILNLAPATDITEAIRTAAGVANIGIGLHLLCFFPVWSLGYTLIVIRSAKADQK